MQQSPTDIKQVELIKLIKPIISLHVPLISTLTSLFLVCPGAWDQKRPSLASLHACDAAESTPVVLSTVVYFWEVSTWEPHKIRRVNNINNV